MAETAVAVLIVLINWSICQSVSLVIEKMRTLCYNSADTRKAVSKAYYYYYTCSTACFFVHYNLGKPVPVVAYSGFACFIVSVITCICICLFGIFLIFTVFTFV